MDKKIYYRGLVAQPWYNFTETLAYIITGKRIPDNIVYGKKIPYGKEKKQYINTFCLKENQNKKKPLFIYIHGGGWISGITEMRNAYILNWANMSFFTCCIGYTYAPQAPFPEQLREVYSAIDYIFENADRYNIDTDNIIISGESAGGYFLSFLASCVEDPTPLDKLGITFKNRNKFKIKALVSHSGCYSVERLCDESKPQSKFPDIKMMLQSFTGMSIEQLREFVKTEEGKLLTPKVNAGYPPCYLAWSTADALRFDTMDFAKELRAHNVPYRMFKGDGLAGNHAWTFVTMLKKGRECLADTFDYVLPLIPDYFENKNGKWSFIG
ncbi:MAG: alpha/beta hydrolase [Clostridia bacterium]|nr:alpha/beta hydrolase [Clostridia bacterium]